jgi:hypothetical protein
MSPKDGGTTTGRRRPDTIERRSRESGTATAREHYHREKARRARVAHPDSELLEAAKREYRALLAQEAARGKGGRPRKKPARPNADTDVPVETEDEQE